MWVAIKLDPANPFKENFFLKGPIIVIGRSPVFDISFDLDRSVSRKHAEIIIESSNPSHSKLFLMDLGSTTGTYLDEKKIAPNVKIEIVNRESIIKFGSINSKSILQIKKIVYNFCATRLDKPEKQLLQMRSNLIGANLLRNVDQATHLITRNIAATVKFLTAVVLNVKVVTLDWLSFIDTPNCMEVIPSEDRFFPISGSNIQIKDPLLSRNSILSDLHIFLLCSSDDEYSKLMIGCGAVISKIYPLPSSHQEWLDKKQELSVLIQLHKNKKICLFFDENKGVEPQIIIENYIPKYEFFWITASLLASSILELSVPQLLDSPPNRIRQTGFSQSQRPATQTNLIKSLPNAIKSLPPSDSFFSSQPLFPQIEVIPQESSQQSSNSSNPTSINFPRSSIKNFHTDGLLHIENAFNNKLNDENIKINVSAKENDEKDSIFSENFNPIVPIKRSQIELNLFSPENLVYERPLKQNRISTELIQNNQILKDAYASHQALITASNVIISQENQNSEKVVLDLMPSPPKCEIIVLTNRISTSDPKISGQIKEENKCNLHDQNHEVDDWIPLIRDVKLLKLDLSDKYNKNESINNNLGEIYPKPEVIERPLILQNPNSYLEPSFPFAQCERKNNFKKFVKNKFLKTIPSSQILQFSSMDKVFPKETDREIQMRLEYQAQEAQKEASEYMFSDRFGMTNKSKRKLI